LIGRWRMVLGRLRHWGLWDTRKHKSP